MLNINTKLAHTTNYKQGRSGKSIVYIVVHYTANDGDVAVGNCNYFAAPGRKASAHYFVDESSIWQSVMDTDTAWHCGGDLQGKGGHSFHGICTNSNSIGVEMCSRIVNGRCVISERTQINAAQLVRQLMKTYGIPLPCVIRHYDVTGKLCPRPFAEDVNQWIRFKQNLEKIQDEGEEEMNRYDKAAELPKALQPEIQQLIDCGALAGSEGKLNITEDMARTMIVNKRYIDKQLNGERKSPQKGGEGK